MKRIATIILLFVFGITATRAQEKRSVVPDTDTSRDEKAIEIGYFDTYEKLPKFTLNTASSAAFHQQKETTGFVQNKLKKKEGYFYIPVAAQQLKFKTYYDNEINPADNGYEYLGFNKKLKLYAVQHNTTSEGLGFGQMILINSTTGYQYRISSFGDWSVSLPKPSPDYKYMVYWQDPEYNSKTLSIAVLKIDEAAKPDHFLTEYAACFVDNGLSIEEIRWKGDHTFYLKAYKAGLRDGKEYREYNYFVATIK